MKLYFALVVGLIFFQGSTVISQPDCASPTVGITVTTVDILFAGSPASTVTGRIGNPLTLVCAVFVEDLNSGTPLPITSYVWTFTNSGEPPVQLSTTEMNLQISVESRDGGEYRCRGVVDGSTCITRESDITTLTTPPEVSIVPSSDLTVEVGARVTFECVAVGWPMPSVMFRKVNLDGTTEELTTAPVYIIDSAIISNSAQYSCRAQYDHGSVVSDTITLTVMEPTTDPPTQPPTTSAGTTEQATTGGDGDGGRSGSRPTTEDGFYIAIAVSAFACLVITLFTIVAVIMWCVKVKNSDDAVENAEPQPQDDTEDIMEEQTPV